MLELVLTVAGPVFQPAEDIYKLHMHTVSAHVKGSLFASLPYGHLELFCYLFDHLFDAPRVNSAIAYEL